MRFALLLLVAGPLVAQEDPAIAAYQKRIHDVVEKTRPGYVFIGGGSGVCVSADGWILTNHHVAGGAKQWKVKFSGGKEYPAEMVGWHPLDDLAVLKVTDGKNLPFVPLGNSDLLKVGDPVIALGNPFMLGSENWEPTVTLGAISALHIYLDNPGYKDAIQTDAQINPGNSGGPLITMKGEVIGINGRIEIRRFMNRVNTGIGYAIPSTQIARFLPHFKAGGRQWGGLLEGVTIGECGDDRYENTGDYGDGVFIAGMSENTPAEKAAFQLGDVIYNVVGYRVYNCNRLHGVVGTYPAGSLVPVKGKRWNKETKEFAGFETKVLLGKIEDMSEYYAQAGNRYYGLVPDYYSDEKGFKVDVVNDGAPGSKAGIQRGDLILRIADTDTPTWPEVRMMFGRFKPADKVKVTLSRAGKVMDVEVTLDQRDLAQDQVGPPKKARPPKKDDDKDKKDDKKKEDEE